MRDVFRNPVGAIDLRILGFAPAVPLAPLERFFPAVWTAFWINAVSGTLLVIGEATKLANLDFAVKMLFIAAAVIILRMLRTRVFHRGRPLESPTDVPRGARALAALTPEGTRLRLVRDPELDDTDRFGRLLRYVLVGERDINVELVRRGAASPYFFRNERGEHALELLDAVETARDARRGFWGACPDARLNTVLGSITGRR